MQLHTFNDNYAVYDTYLCYGNIIVEMWCVRALTWSIVCIHVIVYNAAQMLIAYSMYALNPQNSYWTESAHL